MQPTLAPIIAIITLHQQFGTLYSIEFLSLKYKETRQLQKLSLPDQVDPFGKASGRDLLTMHYPAWFICRNSPQVDLACIPFMPTKPAI
jgi:hypothetical protein